MMNSHPNFNNLLTSNFQRTQSKVWWSDYDVTVQEKKTLNIAWARQGSPSSHKSQDSGFSDTETSPPIRLEQKNDLVNLLNSNNDKLTPKKISINNQINEELSQRTPSIGGDTPVTPPTVIRRTNNLHSPIIRSEFCVARRISFSAPASPLKSPPINQEFLGQIDSLNYSTTSPIHSSQENLIKNEENNKTYSNEDNHEHIDEVDDKLEIENDNFKNESQNCKCDRDRSIKRGRTISRSSKYNRNSVNFRDQNATINENIYNDSLLSPAKSILKPLPSEINNNNNNSTILSLDENGDLPFRTSTPNPESAYIIKTNYGPTDAQPPKCVQSWLSNLRMSFDHEVLSTLQTKSIAVEAGRSLKVTSAISAKLIRSTQTKVMSIQSEFDKLEKLFLDKTQIYLVTTFLNNLTNILTEFFKKQQTRITIYSENEIDFKKFDENINNILEMSIDLRDAGTKFSDDFDLQIIYEDMIILKRYVLITVRMIFEKLIKIIINSIEDTKCELILRSNLSTLSMLSNIDYSGFASLNAAFLANETVRVLLITIIDSKQSSIRALALRALATVCSTMEAIKQFEQCGGIEILKEIMVDEEELRCEPELRETVSVLTQLTAPWHGEQHKIQGMKDCVESFVEAITALLSATSCCQTLLLCAACLNNLSKMEPTSIYSLMSHETLTKLQEAVEKRGPGASIFLYEQITSMLLHMASNKKCHNHLGNKQIINFITKIFQQKFYEKFSSRSETDSQKKTIKNILFIISHLIHESIINPEILEHDVLPIFAKIEKNSSKLDEETFSMHHNGQYTKDITYLNKKLNESLTYKHNLQAQNKNNLSITKKRHESFV